MKWHPLSSYTNSTCSKFFRKLSKAEQSWAKLSKAGPKGPGPKQLTQKSQESQKERPQGPRKAQKETHFWEASEKMMMTMTTPNFSSYSCRRLSRQLKMARVWHSFSLIVYSTFHHKCTFFHSLVCTWNSDCPTNEECYYPTSDASSGICGCGSGFDEDTNGDCKLGKYTLVHKYNQTVKEMNSIPLISTKHKSICFLKASESINTKDKPLKSPIKMRPERNARKIMSKDVTWLRAVTAI